VHHADDAEDVRVVDGEHVGRGGVAGCYPASRDAGVVDQDVEVTGLVTEHGRRRLDGVVAGDIDQQQFGPEVGSYLLAPLGVTCAEVNGVPGGEQATGGVPPEALVRPGDECRCHDIQHCHQCGHQPVARSSWDWGYQAAARRPGPGALILEG
jgi:hypothetical protein